jgi:tetratricopeptide (TPR) repeat protein
MYKKSLLFIGVLISLLACDHKKKTEDKEVSKDPISRQIKLLSDSIFESPKNARLYFERANLYWQKDEMEMALNDFYKTVTYDSTNSDYYYVLANFMVENGNLDRGILAMEKAIQFQPKEPKHYVQTGKYYLYMKDYQKALNYLNDALKLDPMLPDAYFYKGYIYKELKQNDKAISNFTTATEQDPTWYEPFEQIGLIYAAQNNDLALKFYDNAANADKRNTSSRLEKAYYYKKTKRIVESEKEYESIVVDFPQNADAIYSLGVINWEKKNYDKALSQLNICVKIEPTYAPAFYIMGKIYKAKNDKVKAKEAFKQALVFDEKMKEAQQELATL